MPLGEIGRNFGCRNRIAGIGDQGRALEQRDDRRGFSAFRSDLHQTVLCDLHLSARKLHLLAQRLHLGDVEAGVMSNDHHAGVPQYAVECGYEFFLGCSIH